MSIPRVYQCPRLDFNGIIDGNLDKEPWLSCPWTDDFVDIEGDRQPAPRHRTRAKMFWNEEALYVGAYLDEPHLWATLTERDSIIFQDNDFEIFIDPDNDNHLYAEVEVNALNTVWDLLLDRPYAANGVPLSSWRVKGLETAVRMDGTLNNPADEDSGWSVEIKLPWQSLAEISRAPMPPHHGQVCRFNMSRVQWDLDVVDGSYAKRPGIPEYNWVWSPQDVIDMHRPWMWGYLQFLDTAKGSAPSIDFDEFEATRDLGDLFMAQRAHFHAHGHYTAEFQSFEYQTSAEILATPNGFEATRGGFRIDQTGLLTRAGAAEISKRPG